MIRFYFCSFIFCLLSFTSFSQNQGDIIEPETIDHHWVSNEESDSVKQLISWIHEGEDSTLMLCDSKFGFVILSKRNNGWSLYNLFQEEYYIKMFDEHIDTVDFANDGSPELILSFKHGDGKGYEYSAWSAEQQYFLILDTANRKLLINTISAAEYVDYTFYEVDTAMAESEEEYEEMGEERNASGWSSQIEVKAPCFTLSNFVPMEGTEETRECLQEGTYCFKNGKFTKVE